MIARMSANDVIAQTQAIRSDWMQQRHELRERVVQFVIEAVSNPGSLAAYDEAYAAFVTEIVVTLDADYHHQRFERGVGVISAAHGEVLANITAWSKVTRDKAGDALTVQCVTHIITYWQMKTRRAAAEKIVRDLTRSATDNVAARGMGTDPMYGID